MNDSWESRKPIAEESFAGIFALIGFVLWDRMTALAPAIRKNRELEER